MTTPRLFGTKTENGGTKSRTCLKCGLPFTSDYNRICLKCHKENAKVNQAIFKSPGGYKLVTNGKKKSTTNYGG